MCHVDVSYDAAARQLSSRTLPCLNEPLGHSFNVSSYAAVGENYTLRAPTPGAQLRVTYVSTTSAGNLVSGLRALVESFEASTHTERPDFVYANTGAHILRDRHGKSREPNGSVVLSALHAFAQSHTVPPHTLVWGTAVAHRSWARLDDELLPQLSAEWGVLNRNTTLHRLMSRKGSTGVRMSSSHAPHLINQVDALRLFIANAAPRRAQADTSPSIADSSSCAALPTLGYTPACAGTSFGAPRSNWWDTASKVFIYAWQHYCHVQVLRGGLSV